MKISNIFKHILFLGALALPGLTTSAAPHAPDVNTQAESELSRGLQQAKMAVMRDTLRMMAADEAAKRGEKAGELAVKGSRKPQAESQKSQAKK